MNIQSYSNASDQLDHISQLEDGDYLDIDSLSVIYKGCADPFRMEILQLLNRSSYSVSELCDILKSPQPAMSHHLKKLASAGLVTSKRHGNNIFYRRPLVAKDHWKSNVFETIFKSVDQCSPATDKQKAVAAVYERRAETAKDYFKKNHRNFSTVQEKIAVYSEYASALTSIIEQTSPPLESRVAEVGPADSNFLHYLSKRFKHVTAIDQSVEMLELSKKSLKENPLQIEWIEQDFHELANVKRTKKFDFIFMNMVLHHMPDPGLAFKSASSLLSERGSLVISDLKSHEQTWVKSSCGDLWQGFEPEELDSWASKYNFTNAESQYIGLKNGFEVQIKSYVK